MNPKDCIREIVVLRQIMNISRNTGRVYGHDSEGRLNAPLPGYGPADLNEVTKQKYRFLSKPEQSSDLEDGMHNLPERLKFQAKICQFVLDNWEDSQQDPALFSSILSRLGREGAHQYTDIPDDYNIDDIDRGIVITQSVISRCTESGNQNLVAWNTFILRVCTLIKDMCEE